mmetsp:Transcript_12860/g.22209  ORF Transcript_12860/g.22209 Transcript_12860/m.22209 type:complete len:218 (+) Transcript_12860:419-1072(+)
MRARIGARLLLKRTHVQNLLARDEWSGAHNKLSGRSQSKRAKFGFMGPSRLHVRLPTESAGVFVQERLAKGRQAAAGTEKSSRSQIPEWRLRPPLRRLPRQHCHRRWPRRLHRPTSLRPSPVFRSPLSHRAHRPDPFEGPVRRPARSGLVSGADTGAALRPVPREPLIHAPTQTPTTRRSGFPEVFFFFFQQTGEQFVFSQLLYFPELTWIGCWLQG